MSGFVMLVAAAENGVIGKGNTLPWRLPSDLKWFKETTSGGVVIMGRKTFESIGKPLPNRINIVISRNLIPKELSNKVIWVGSVAEAVGVCRAHYPELRGRWFVIGGGEIYRAFMPYADNIVITRVNAVVDGDTTFPPLNLRAWVTNGKMVGPSATEGDQYTYERESWCRLGLFSTHVVLHSGRISEFKGLPKEQITQIFKNWIEGGWHSFRFDKESVEVADVAKQLGTDAIESLKALDRLSNERIGGFFSSMVLGTDGSDIIVTARLQPLHPPITTRLLLEFVPRVRQISCAPGYAIERVELLPFYELDL